MSLTKQNEALEDLAARVQNKLTQQGKSSILNEMAKLKIAKIIPVGLALVGIAVTIAALVTIVRISFFSGGNTQSGQMVDNGRKALLDISANSSVKMIVRGQIVADEDYETFQIEVGPSRRILSSTKGYLDESTVITEKINNIPAYEQFVYALDKANLAKGVELEDDKNDLRGVCATGRVYSFQIINDEKIVKQLWTSTCSGSLGSLQASLGQVSNLFYTQLPESKSVIGGLWQ